MQGGVLEHSPGKTNRNEYEPRTVSPTALRVGGNGFLSEGQTLSWGVDGSILEGIADWTRYIILDLAARNPVNKDSLSKQLTIVIQAGGRSSRMGQDKALMPFLGRPLIERQVERLRALDAGLLVVTNRPEAYAFLNVPLYPDRVQGLGPLGGLLTAFEAAESLMVGVVACDMPFLNPSLLQAQGEMLEREGADVVIPRSPEGLEPMHAIYRRERCLPAVQRALEAGQRKMTAWFSDVIMREMSSQEIARIDPDFRSFVNVNSPEEFKEAEAWARQSGDSRAVTKTNSF